MFAFSSLFSSLLVSFSFNLLSKEGGEKKSINLCLNLSFGEDKFWIIAN